MLKPSDSCLQLQMPKPSEGSRGRPLSGVQDDAPYMQGYQPTLRQGLRQEPYRKSASFQDTARGQRQEAYRKSASFQDAVSPGEARAAAQGPDGVARMPSSMAGLQQNSGRIAAVRPAGYEESEGQKKNTADVARLAEPPARRTGSLLLNRKQRAGSISVADRLKSVRGLMDSSDEPNSEDIQEDLPLAAAVDSDSFGTSNIDEAIAEEPQLVAAD